MPFADHVIEAPDGHRIAARLATPEGTPRGLVQVLHGLAEHGERYARFAAALNEAGWAVIHHDHRGHGKSAASDADLGHFADHDGWRRVIEDVRAVRAFGREQVPDGELVLFGHSMGTFVSLTEQIDAPGSIDKLVLSGGNCGGGLLVAAGLRIAKLERFRQGPRGRSNLIEKMSFGSFNDAFKPVRTESDWLSRDPDEVDKYVDDPRCGFQGTNQLWIDLIGALIDLGKHERLARLPPELPVYMFCGDADPVSQGGAGVRKLGDQLRRAGVRNVKVKVYPEGRHESLNETNRDEVTQDVIDWIG